MNENIKKYNLKNDVIFKAFFSRKQNEEFLIEFLNALLGIEIINIEIKEEVNLEQLAITEKGGRLDLQARLNDDTIANIELQIKDYGNIEVRTSYYAAKVIAREIRSGTDYEDIEKIIMISILGYNMFEEYQNEYIHKTAIVHDKHREKIVNDSIEWWFIELPKFRKLNPNMNEKINQWMAFIDDEDKELVTVAEQKNKTLKKARLELNYLTGDAEVRRLAELREKWDIEWEVSRRNAIREGEKQGKAEGIKQGKAEGIKQGKAEGIKQGKAEGIKQGQVVGMKKKAFEIAQRLIESGMDLNKVSEMTGISKNELKEIIKE